MNEHDKKNIQVKFVCSREALAQIDYSARKAGMSRSGYMRDLALQGFVDFRTNFTKEDTRELLIALCDISNSMAEISYIARLNRTVDEGELLQVESTVKGLVREIGRLITG